MMDFFQLERYAALIDSIDRARLIAESDGLRAASRDGMPRSGTHLPSRLDNIAIRRDRARKELTQLQARAAAERPAVEATICAATAGHGRDIIKTALILRARYLSGRNWLEIADMLHLSPEKVKSIVETAVERAAVK